MGHTGDTAKFRARFNLWRLVREKVGLPYPALEGTLIELSQKPRRRCIKSNFLLFL
jgi:hypothetical protein